MRTQCDLGAKMFVCLSLHFPWSIYFTKSVSLSTKQTERHHPFVCTLKQRALLEGRTGKVPSFVLCDVFVQLRCKSCISNTLPYLPWPRSAMLTNILNGVERWLLRNVSLLTSYKYPSPWMSTVMFPPPPSSNPTLERLMTYDPLEKRWEWTLGRSKLIPQIIAVEFSGNCMTWVD